MDEQSPFEALAPLAPASYFAITADCHYRKPNAKKALESKYRLPDLSALCGEDPFADFFLSWSEEGIEVYVTVNRRHQQTTYPQIEQGDSVELFIDTRDVKSSRWNTRFCHHFFFLPEAVEGIIAGEKTHFRTEDAHELCNSNELQLQVTRKQSSYQLYAFIPNHCLFGYDPTQFNRLGFTYRINAFKHSPQHFSAVSSDYLVDQQPWLWSSLTLVK